MPASSGTALWKRQTPSSRPISLRAASLDWKRAPLSDTRLASATLAAARSCRPWLRAWSTSTTRVTVAVHRTYLRADGTGKADVEPTKASLGPVWGGAIRLHPHDPDRPLVIGEGIETSASAGIMLQAPAWSAISAGNLGGGVVLPPEVRDIIVAADTDDEGDARAHQAAWRWKREGRSVRLARPRLGDWNDTLIEELR